MGNGKLMGATKIYLRKFPNYGFFLSAKSLDLTFFLLLFFSSFILVEVNEVEVS